MNKNNVTLFVMSGLPGVGKSTISRALAETIHAIWLRIDSIEAGIKDGDLGVSDLKGAGYCAAENVAKDNLALGHSVIADCVNPIHLTRDRWANIANNEGYHLIEIEVICPNKAEHKSRVEARVRSNNWAAVEARYYEPWRRAVFQINSAELSPQKAVEKILAGPIYSQTS